DVNELAHHCPDHTHLALTSLSQTLGPLLKEGTTTQRGDRWKVKRLAQTRVADALATRATGQNQP
ncbi:MAG: hypothetical protein ACR2H4_20835, partial [Pyrinomonadaceae bacterium]